MTTNGQKIIKILKYLFIGIKDIEIIIMNNKYTWTKNDNIICSICYLQNKTYIQTHLLSPHISLNSINMKYKNCMYLDKGKINGSLENCSKLHKEIWISVKTLQF